MPLNINYKSKRFALWALVALVCVFLTVATFGDTNRLPFDSEESYPLNEGWSVVDSSGKVIQPVTLPCKLDVDNGDPVYISRVLPDEIPDPVVLCFRSSQQMVRVFLDEEEVYSFGYDVTPIFGKSPGSAWNMVRLPEHDADSRITVELVTPYPTYYGIINDIRAGSKASLLFYLLDTYLLSFILTGIIFIAGIIMVLVHMLLIRRNSSSAEMLYLGIFSVTISIWLLGESRLVQFFVGNTYLTLCVAFVAMLVAPIPLFKFIACIKDFRYKRVLEVMNIFLYAQLCIVMLLQMSNSVDFIEIMPFMHAMLIACSSTALVLMIIDWLINHNIHAKSLMFSLLLMCVFFVLEVCLLYSETITNTGDLMRAGVLVFITLQARIAFKKAVQIMRLSRMASLDALTGCQNRTAYIQRLMELDGKPGVGVVMADLNDLKLINDSYGHDAGDDALIRQARCFNGALSPYGDCYRIGGDEFIFLGVNMSPEKLRSVTGEIDALQVEERKSADYPFSVAYGYAIYSEKRDQTLTDTVRRADRVMYRNKRMLKSTANTVK